MTAEQIAQPAAGRPRRAVGAVTVEGMPERVAGCGSERTSHRWVEVGNRLVCRDCDLVDFVWSLCRRRMIEALRRAGLSSPEVS